MAKKKDEKGYMIGDIKPFGMDDPLGQGHKSKKLLKEPPRAHMPGQKAADLGAPNVAAPGGIAGAPPAPAKKGPSGCAIAGIGCLVLIGLMIAGMIAPVAFLGGMIKEAWDQYSVRDTGVDAPAEIVSLEETNMTFNDEQVYDVALRVTPEDRDPFDATVPFPFSAREAANVKPGDRVIVRYDPNDPEKLTIMGRPSDGITDPTDDPQSGAATDPTAPDAGNPTHQGLGADPNAPDTATNGDAVAAAERAIAEAQVPEVCKATARCCLAVHGQTTVDSCTRFLDPAPTTKHCAAALEVYRKVADKLGRSCAP